MRAAVSHMQMEALASAAAQANFHSVVMGAWIFTFAGMDLDGQRVDGMLFEFTGGP